MACFFADENVMTDPTNTELDATTFPAWQARIADAEMSGAALARPPRRYPGYPTVSLPRCGARWTASLDSVLAGRRSPERFTTRQPSRRVLGRLLQFAHGITGDTGRGPVPSAGGLQGLELYVGVLAPGWLPAGVYHYDRGGHWLSELERDIARDEWETLVPVLPFVPGGSLLWILVGDGARVMAKYGERGRRFLLLEAGHLMQNLCLLSMSLGLGTRPLGGYFETALAQRMRMLADDDVLYLGLCGQIAR